VINVVVVSRHVTSGHVLNTWIDGAEKASNGLYTITCQDASAKKGEITGVALPSR
jgi:hypothetical protein